MIRVHRRRRIVYLRGPEGHEDSVSRENGYRQALEANKIRFDPGLIAAGGFDDEEAFVAIQGLLSKRVSFDAVFAGDDDAAIGALRALKLAGKIVPKDVAVVGFDDVPFVRYLSPALTTVRAPIEQVGREAVRQLVKRIHGEAAQALTLLPTELVFRESCGCLSSSAGNPESPLVTPRR